MGSILVGYGLVAAGLAFALRQIAPALAEVTFLAGLLAGGLLVLWGVLAWAGHKRRTWAVLTLVALGFVLVSQVVHAWSTPANETPGKMAGALLLTVLTFMNLGMLIYLLHGERPPEFYRTAPARRNGPE